MAMDEVVDVVVVEVEVEVTDMVVVVEDSPLVVNAWLAQNIVV
jgi:hypothetical protein